MPNNLQHIMGSPNSCFSGRSTSTVAKELCKIVWIIEGELKDDQLLYVTGDIACLGCWNTEMAVLMEPTEDANIWKAEAEVDQSILFLLMLNSFCYGRIKVSCCFGTPSRVDLFL